MDKDKCINCGKELPHQNPLRDFELRPDRLCDECYCMAVVEKE